MTKRRRPQSGSKHEPSGPEANEFPKVDQVQSDDEAGDATDDGMPECEVSDDEMNGDGEDYPEDDPLRGQKRKFDEEEEDD